MSVIPNFFETVHAFIHNEKRSRDYVRARASVRDGMQLIEGPHLYYRVGIEGSNIGIERDFAGATARVKELKKKYPQQKVVAKSYRGDDEFVDQVRFLQLTKSPPIKDGELCPGGDRFIAWVENERKRGRLRHVRYAGGCVCKSTASGGHSDHADCAAVDIFSTNEEMEYIRDGALRYADYFDAKYAILFARIWYSLTESDPYGGIYHSHVHVSFNGGRYNSACH